MAGTIALAGRTKELGTLMAAAAAAAAGTSQTVFLGGPTGVGKSALTSAFVQQLPAFRTLGVSGVATERHLTYAAANRLIQSARSGARGGARRTEAVPPDSTITAAGGALISATDDYRADAPLVLVVEDAHLLDAPSLQALGFMLLRMTRDPLVTVVNTEHLHETRQAMGLSGSVDHVTQLVLGGLDLAATRSVLAEQGVTNLSESHVMHVARWSRGNPLYITALAGTADAEHRIPERFLAAEVPPSLAEAVRQWCRTFSPGARRVLEALAVLNMPVAERTLSRMVPGADLGADIRSLVAGGAAQWIPAPHGHPRLELVHPVQREAVYASMPSSQRRLLHRTAAEILASPGNWRHRIDALDGYDAPLAAQLTESARREERKGDPSVAAQYELGVATIAPDPDERSEALLRAVRLMVMSGQYDAALGYTPLVKAHAASATRSEVLGLLDYARGHDISAAEHLRSAREGFAEHSDEDAARASVELASLQRSIGLGEQSLRSARYALARTSDPQIIGEAQASIAFGTALRDGPAAGLALIRHLRENPTEIPAADITSLVCRGVLRGLSGNLSGAVDDLRYVTRRHAPGLTRRNHYESAIHAASCHFLLGEWGEARRALSLAFDEAQVSGRDVDFVSLHSASASLYACQGRREEADADLAQARAVARGVDFGGPDFNIRQAAATSDFARGNWHGVVAELLRALKDSANDGRAKLFGVWYLPLLGVACARVDDLTTATEAHEALAAVAPTGALPVVARHWVRGNILLADGRADAAARVFRDGLAVPPEGGEPVLHRTMVRCDLARALACANRRAEAASQASAAELTFTKLGAHPFAAWCRDVLEDEGSPTEVTEAERFWGELTDRERDTARLVGLGWTNKEIAAELFVSTKTVEYHLGNAYAKGALKNRRQLRGLMQVLGR